MSQKELELETRDGQKVVGKVYGISPRGNTNLKQHLAILGRFMGRAESTQLPFEGIAINYAREGVTLAPPIPLSYYVTLYRNDPIHRACVDAKVSCVAMQGYKIRPRREMALVDNSTVAVFTDPGEEPDEAQKLTALKFLESGMPEYSFIQTLQELWLDYETTGNAYLEFSRNGMGVLDGMYPLRSVTVQVLAGGKGYIQTRSGKTRYFSKYNGKGGRVGVLLEAKKEDKSGKQGKAREMLYIPRDWGDSNALAEKAKITIVDQVEDIAEGASGAKVVNEVMAFRNPSPLDTPYGEPDVLSAVYDILGSESAALFNLNYFENATIPRLAILIQGGEMSKELEEKITAWVRDQAAPDVLNQVLVVEIPDKETEVKIQPLGVAQLGDAGFLDYRSHCGEHVAAANRTPLGIIGMGVESSTSASTEANIRFIATVIRPRQRLIESKMNYVLENELGVTDWVLELLYPELTTPLERAKFYDVLISRGVVAINDVRRFYGLAPADGGDEPFIQVVGQGAVPIKFLEEVVEANLGTRGNPLIATSGEQTPSNVAPLVRLPGTQKVAAIDTSVLDAMEPNDRETVVSLLEGLGLAGGADPQVGPSVRSAVNPALGG